MIVIPYSQNPEFLIQSDSLNKFYKLAINAHSLSGIFQKEVTNKNYNELPSREQEKVNTHVAKRIQEIERLVNAITDNKYYQTWIYKQLAKQTFSFPEDFEKVQDLIKHYHQVKNSGNFPVEYKNILIFETYSKLHAIVSTYSKELSDGDVFYTAGNNPVIYDQDGVKVIQLNDYDDAEFLLNKTGWCVKQERVFNTTYGPPFYLFVSGNKKIALLHVGQIEYDQTYEDEPWKIPDLSLKDIHDNALSTDKAQIIMNALEWVLKNNHNTTIPNVLYKVIQIDSSMIEDPNTYGYGVDGNVSNDIFSIFESMKDSDRKYIMDKASQNPSIATSLIDNLIDSGSVINEEIVDLVLASPSRLVWTFMNSVMVSDVTEKIITASIQKIHEIADIYVGIAAPIKLRHFLNKISFNTPDGLAMNKLFVTDTLFIKLIERIMREAPATHNVLDAIRNRFSENASSYFKIIFDIIIDEENHEAAYHVYSWFFKNYYVNDLPDKIIEMAVYNVGPSSLLMNNMPPDLNELHHSVWIALANSSHNRDVNMLERLLTNDSSPMLPVPIYLKNYIIKNRPDLAEKFFANTKQSEEETNDF